MAYYEHLAAARQERRRLSRQMRLGWAYAGSIAAVVFGAALALGWHQDKPAEYFEALVAIALVVGSCGVPMAARLLRPCRCLTRHRRLPGHYYDAAVAAVGLLVGTAGGFVAWTIFIPFTVLAPMLLVAHDGLAPLIALFLLAIAAAPLVSHASRRARVPRLGTPPPRRRRR